MLAAGKLLPGSQYIAVVLVPAKLMVAPITFDRSELAEPPLIRMFDPGP
jgi:hypothetical protein